MPAQTVEVVNENGTVVEEVITTTDFFVKVNDQFRQPIITNEVEIENDSSVSTVEDQCGNVERNKVGNQGWKIRVTGLVSGNAQRDSNLSVQALRDVVALSDTIEIKSDIISGQFELSNTVITQSSDVAQIDGPQTSGPESVYSFQMQLGETDS